VRSSRAEPRTVHRSSEEEEEEVEEEEKEEEEEDAQLLSDTSRCND